MAVERLLSTFYQPMISSPWYCLPTILVLLGSGCYLGVALINLHSRRPDPLDSDRYVWQRWCPPGILLFLLLPQCALWEPAPVQPELTEAGVQKALRVRAEQNLSSAQGIVSSGEGRRSSAGLSLERKIEPGTAVFSLRNAIAVARRKNPRLKSAHASIDRAMGKTETAFAPLLPQIIFGAQNGFTSSNQAPGGFWPTGEILSGRSEANHSYIQESLGLTWILYDFGRRAGRYQQAIAQERMTRILLTRANQTVELDVAAAYLNILMARAAILTQEDAIRQAKYTLRDSRVFVKEGVATPDYVARAEVHLAESRDVYVRAQEAELNAAAQLNNVMGRNGALPLQIHDLKLPPGKDVPMLKKCLEIAGAKRPEIAFAREAVAAAQGGLASAKGAFGPTISVRALGGRLDGVNVLTGWQAGAGLHLVFPVYTGGMRSGELRAARAEVSAAMADAQVILNKVSMEVSQAVYGVESASRRLELARPAVAQARENLREVRVRYRNGDAYPTDIVDGENALTLAQQRYYTAYYNYLFSLARLDYAMGREQVAIL